MAVNNLITLRKGTNSEWIAADPILASGEPGFDITNNLLKIGDGITNWLNLSPTITSDIQVYVKNTTNSNLTKGQVVYINGAIGSNPTIQLSIASGESASSKTIGLLKQNLSINEFGYIVSEGILEGIDTDQATSAGDPMWLSPTISGGIVYGVANKPVAPNHMVFLGYVLRKQQNNGKVYVKVQNGFELGELHNVFTNGTTDGQFLQYNSSSGLWLASNSGNFTNLTINGTGISLSGHSHTSANITDWNEAVDDRVSSLLVGTSGINISYNDSANTLTIAYTGSSSGGGGGVAVSNYADNRIITSDGTSTGLNAESGLTFDGIIFSAPSGNFTNSLTVNNTGVSISGHTHTVSQITNINDIATTLFTGRTGISLTYDSISDTLYIDTTGIAYQNHSHTTSDISNFNSGVSGLVSGIYAPLTGKLSQFSNTSSSELSSVISDETGSGLLVFNNSPTFTGIPIVPTAASGTNTNQIASTSFVRTEVSNLVASAPSTLDTLNELAAALGNDANFSTTVTNSLAAKANLSGASFTGSISSPSGSFSQSLQLNGTGVSLNGHTHTSSQITDFNSSVSGLLPVKALTAGTNIAISSTTGNYTISVTGVTGGSSLAEYSTTSTFPATGVSGTLYIETDHGQLFRWTGSQYAELGPIASNVPSGSLQSVGNSTATKTLSLNDAYNGILSMTLTANCTVTMPTVTAGQRFTLLLSQDSTGGYTCSFTDVKWAGGSAPTITTTKNGTDIIDFVCDGTYWLGKISQAYPTYAALSAEYLVVAGGGAGGYDYGGGGGGGGVRYGSLSPTLGVGLTVTVGSGGTPNTNNQSGSGGNSVFSTITSAGGGGGGKGAGTGAGNNAGAAGGCGGGAAGNWTSGTNLGGAATPVTSPVQGYAGGNGIYSNSSNNDFPSGGGGGATGVGVNGVAGQSGNGGPGYTSTITGSSVVYGAGGGG